MAAQIQVVDDDPAMLDLLRWRLQAAGYAVHTYESAEAFLSAASTAQEPEPSCLLLDLHLPGLSGLELLERHVPSAVPFPVIVLSSAADVPLVVRAMKLGATSYLHKPLGDELERTVAAALREDAARLEARRLLDDEERALGRLTPREREVLAFIALGDSNRMVATRLGLSVRTVEAYRARVMEKLQVESLAELVRLATRLGVEPPAA